jgi:eukaryotic-like serine/threonine-protein kinase
MMPEERLGARLTPDGWRRICDVLDRLHDAPLEARDRILADACHEQDISVDQVKAFVDATEGSESLPEGIPPELIDDALGDLSQNEPAFQLDAGRRLGPYEIVAFLGAGGMGEVYRANDSRLGRTVAIKVLRPHLLQSPAAQQRFDREARAISRLNHPHVCTLYDVGHQDGLDFLVMEYVEGETLARRLERGPIAVAQAVRFGSQIADAVQRAHRHGIVHRDLKPANIILTSSGIKLLDFGLAQLDVAGAPDDAALIGTPQYMAPEQLDRRQADSRSDIFACGAVLYEMVTGTGAFTAQSQSDVIVAVLQKDPARIPQLVPDAPAALDWTISKCLAKDPDDRWQSAADLKHHLDWLAASAGTSRPPLPFSRSALWIAATIALAVVLFVAWTWRQRARESPPAAASIFPIYPPVGTTFDLTHAIAPDGRRIAFTAVPTDGPRELWIRSLDSLAPQRVAGSEGAAHPFWSPDGRLVGFFADQKLKKIDLTSGNVHVICDVAGAGGGGSWSRNDVIIFAARGHITGLWRVSASGGAATEIMPTSTGRTDAWPRFLRDDQHFLYMRAGSSDNGVYLGRLDSADAQTAVLRTSSTPPTKAVLANDILFFLEHGTLMAQRFDATRMTTMGEPVRVVENVRWGPPGTAAFDAASGGVVAYRQPAPERLAQLTWLDQNGRTIAHVGNPGPNVAVAISPDGRSALVNEWDVRGRAASGIVTRLDLGTGAATALFRNAASPIWSADGSRIVFTQFSLGLGGAPTPMLMALDGRTPARPLADFGSRQAHATDWSRDGRFVVGSARTDTMWDLWIADAEGREPLRYLAPEPFHQREAHISPDGRWVAYASADARGDWHIHLRSFPDGRLLRRVSTRGGRSPRWRSDGRELYFVEPGGRLMRVRIATESDLSLGVPELMFQHAGLAEAPEGSGFTYDVAPDGRFLVGVPTPDETPSAPIIVMLNWSFPAAASR